MQEKTKDLQKESIITHLSRLLLKPLPVPISLEKKLKLWNDQRCDSEKIRKKLEEVLSQTTGMASLKGSVYISAEMYTEPYKDHVLLKDKHPQIVLPRG